MCEKERERGREGERESRTVNAYPVLVIGVDNVTGTITTNLVESTFIRIVLYCSALGYWKQLQTII